MLKRLLGISNGLRGIDETSRKRKRLNEAEIALRHEEIATSDAPPHCCRLGLRSPAQIVLWHHSRVAFAHTLLRHLLHFTPATPCTKGTNASDVAARVSQPCQRVRRRASLGQGWGSVRDQQGSPSSRRVDIRAFNTLLSTFSAMPGGPKGSTPSGNEVYGRHLTV